MKVRLAYSKTSSGRYVAHLDMMRLFQRAFRRAAVDIAYSEGFNPHAKISFGAPLPVGIAGEREYADVEIRDITLADMQKAFIRLCSQMPPGITLLSWTELPVGATKLMALLDTAVYWAEVPWLEESYPMAKETAKNYPKEDGLFSQALERWLAQAQILWQRRKEGRSLSINIRPFIRWMIQSGHSLSKRDGTNNELMVKDINIEQSKNLESDKKTAPKVVFEIATVLGNAGSVRPIEILGAFCRDEGFKLDIEQAQIRRTGVYWLDTRGDLHAPDEF